jgi:hypothetical protein
VPYYFLMSRPLGNVVVPLSESGILRGALKLRALIPVSRKSVNVFLCMQKRDAREKRDERHRHNTKFSIPDFENLRPSRACLARLAR